MRLLDRCYDQLYGSWLPAQRFAGATYCVAISAAVRDFESQPTPVGAYQAYAGLYTPWSALWCEYATRAGLRVGHHWAQVTFAPEQRTHTWRAEVLEHAFMATAAPETAPLPRALDRARRSRRPARRQTGHAPAALSLCTLLRDLAAKTFSLDWFGCYLDQAGRPWADLALAVMPVAGGGPLAPWYPLFHALTLLRTAQAWLQAAPDVPRPSAWYFDAVVLPDQHLLCHN